MHFIIRQEFLPEGDALHAEVEGVEKAVEFNSEKVHCAFLMV